MENAFNWIIFGGTSHSSGSMLVSPEGFLASDNGNSLLLVELASTRPSDANVKGPVPDDEPNNRRTVGGSVEDDETLYVKTPIGWSNLQLGPNLQIPFLE